MGFMRKYQFTCDKCGNITLTDVDNKISPLEHSFKKDFAFLAFDTGEFRHSYYLCCECRNLFNEFMIKE